MDDPRAEEIRLLVQLQELKDRLAELAHENAELRVERDIAQAQVTALLPKATPEQEEELRQLMESGEKLDFSEFVVQMTAELEGGRGDR